MKDLNFFEAYIEKKEFKANKQWILFAAIGVILIALLSKGIYNQVIISKLNKEVSQLKSIAEDPNTLERVNIVKGKEEEINRFKEEVDKIKNLDEIIEGEDIINSDFLYLISSRLPKDAFLTSLSISNDEMNLTGIAEDTWSIAEFSKGLEYIDEVDEIFISDISQESDFYNFNINVMLKGVISDGE
ncbi:MAG: PilN domain-containing protein [Tissierellaceae bacterium]|nr:PilN domain-containing protein [Tissierellaceae bacterium]